MKKVKLNNGTEVEAYLVTRFAFPAQIHIFPSGITISDIYRIFDDPEATAVITVEEENEDTGAGEKNTEAKVYRGYTELFSVQKSMYHPEEKEYMIWLQQPEVPDGE